MTDNPNTPQQNISAVTKDEEFFDGLNNISPSSAILTIVEWVVKIGQLQYNY